VKLGTAGIVAAAVVAVDQISKAVIVARLPLGADLPVVRGLFDLVHSRNRGIAFGILGSAGEAVQIGVLFLVIGVVLLIVRQLARTGDDGLATLGLSLVLGGALGNLIDRLFRGGVVDFLDFYLRWGGREHHWPSFNAADSAITVGAGLVILAELLRGRRRTHASDPP
jgi:signal peptidase II